MARPSRCCTLTDLEQSALLDEFIDDDETGRYRTNEQSVMLPMVGKCFS
jgi:hypothetical protein